MSGKAESSKKKKRSDTLPRDGFLQASTPELTVGGRRVPRQWCLCVDWREMARREFKNRSKTTEFQTLRDIGPAPAKR
jgi:hypothetical protein